MNYNKDFLYMLSRQKHRIVYIRLTALDLSDNILESLEGVVNQGSISIDGKSAVRRSINLTANILNANEIKTYIWALKTKCKIEIGLNNSINSNYDNIIWFNQGIFILTAFSSSYSLNQIQTISLQGRDKMCNLDGSVGGVLVAGGTFDSYDYMDENGYIEKNIKYPVKQIIRDLVHQFGNEPFHNIFINDLDMEGMELLEYRNTEPLYLWRLVNSSQYINGTAIKEQPCTILATNESTTINNIVYENLFNLESDSITPSIIHFGDKTRSYYCTKIEYGNTAGYQLIDLIYPDTLEAKAGESVTSILDKIIKNLLSNYEYFYDTDGHFIFQKKRSYDVEEFSSIRTNSNGIKYALSLTEAQQEEIAYTFGDFELITAFSENPNIANVKNDFTVWGERSGVDGDKLPIHMRYAIDNYPTQYTTIEVTADELIDYNKKYGLNVQPQQSITFIASPTFKQSKNLTSSGDRINNALNPSLYLDQCYYVNWREVLWQMQNDYRKFNHLDNFEQKVIAANGSLYPSGKTGYEQYYIDIEGFWREQYNLLLWSDILNDAGLQRQLKHDTNYFYIRGITSYEIKDEIERLKQIAQGQQNIEDIVYDDAGILFPTEGDSQLGTLINSWETRFLSVLQDLDQDAEPHYAVLPKNYYYKENEPKTLFWNKKVFEAPNQLNFYIDFMSGDSELMKNAGVPNIQHRPKVETNNDVKAIDYAKVPNIIYCKNAVPNVDKQRSDYSYFYVGDKMDKMFTRATQGLSAKEAIQDMVYNYAQTAEAVSITCIPIYHLEPNTKIHIDSDEYDIHDDYVIQSMTIPLAYNGTMSISATKARKRIF